MNDLFLKGVVSVIALYAAANPWFRHHNVADPADLLAVVALFLSCLFAIGGDGTTILWIIGAIVVLDLAAHAVFALRHVRLFLAFGAGRRHFKAFHDLVQTLSSAQNVAAAKIVQTEKTPWLLRLEGVPARQVAAFVKALDKALRPLLGLEFHRYYPATIVVLAFLAAVWRYL